jgi:hypothetical protein
MRLLATAIAVVAVVLALGVVVRGRFLLGGRPVSSWPARVAGVGLVTMMLSVLARLQMDDDRVADALATLGLGLVIVAVVVDSRVARR